MTGRKTLNNPIPIPNSQNTRLVYRDTGHVPANKTAGQTDSLLTAYFDRSEEGQWLTIDISETTIHPTGKLTSRNMVTTIPMDLAKKIARFITSGNPDET